MYTEWRIKFLWISVCEGKELKKKNSRKILKGLKSAFLSPVFCKYIFFELLRNEYLGITWVVLSTVWKILLKCESPFLS